MFAESREINKLKLILVKGKSYEHGVQNPSKFHIRAHYRKSLPGAINIASLDIPFRRPKKLHSNYIGERYENQMDLT